LHPTHVNSKASVPLMTWEDEYLIGNDHIVCS
jgi:hypothetical protein